LQPQCSARPQSGLLLQRTADSHLEEIAHERVPRVAAGLLPAHAGSDEGRKRSKSNHAMVKPSSGQTKQWSNLPAYEDRVRPLQHSQLPGAAVRRRAAVEQRLRNQQLKQHLAVKQQSSLINKTRQISSAPVTSRSCSFCLAVQNCWSPFRRQMDAEPCHALLHHDLDPWIIVCRALTRMSSRRNARRNAVQSLQWCRLCRTMACDGMRCRLMHTGAVVTAASCRQTSSSG
jgi:hypothetical protein